MTFLTLNPAVMGGSGSGKSSLLNALCGRAGYGKVTGVIKINGNKTTIDEHKNVIGFVPQDDIVYPDLSVRENLVSRRMFLSHSVWSLTRDHLLGELSYMPVDYTSLVGQVNRRSILLQKKLWRNWAFRESQTLLLVMLDAEACQGARRRWVS